jgi:phenylpropionate dioxygenase-like ring-hydroxylating dioxygenase large terminal subunit
VPIADQPILEEEMTVLSVDATDGVVEHLRKGTTDLAPSPLRVPISNFFDKSHAAVEHKLFRRLPLNVAHTSEISKVGSFITREVLGTQLLIARGEDAKVVAYVNMCRHRGGKVEWQASGNKRMFVCPYHGWSYDRNSGELKNVPYEKDIGPIDRACNSLERVRAEERNGFVWIDFINDRHLPIAGYLGNSIDATLASLALNERIIYLDKSFTLPINWKLVIDGAIDMLHPQFLHPDGVGKLIKTNTVLWKGHGRHGQLFAARQRLAETVRVSGDFDRDWRYFAGSIFVYPNSLINPTPDHVECWTVWPSLDNPAESTTKIRFLVHPDRLNEKTRQRLDLSWEILNKAAGEEDWPMEVSIQENSRSHPDGSYLYGRNEIACQHFHRNLAEDLGWLNKETISSQ